MSKFKIDFMNKILSVIVIFIGLSTFAQSTEYKSDSLSNTKTTFIINGIDFSSSRAGEKSLALAMDKLSDYELMELIRKYLTVDGKLPPKKEK